MKLDWNALQHRLGGAVVVAGAPDYDVARRPAIARFADARPAAVVFAATAADVAATIQFARTQIARDPPFGRPLLRWSLVARRYRD